MAQCEIWKKIDELKHDPELAGTPGYEIADLLKKSDAADWFLLLMEQPQFKPPHDWWFGLRSRCDLPWAMLLGKQPQFEPYAHWESVNRLELMKLAYLAPEIYGKHFPKTRPWDLYAFLTPVEKCSLLCELPRLENQVDWDELDGEWDTGDWLMLLSAQPQFEKYFDWSRVEKQHSYFWDVLLRCQPQFARHCDPANLEEWQVRRIRKYQPQLFAGVPA
ncbi:MAG: hypothetical protein IJS14_00900 [Lentisphaeria bacterium]|nr:hypothetical protein [Lentisphaeria bacterium]